jgi:hypothetical protein
MNLRGDTRALLLAWALPLAAMQLGCGGTVGCSGATGSSCTRVLFLGNSYTSVNDLPAMFATLADSGGHHVDTGALDDGGATLTDHLASPATGAALSSGHWSVVVLQEQSQAPSSAQLRQSGMYPAARRLITMARGAGTRPIFFLPWAHRDGWPERGLPDYTSMQVAVDDGYLTIAHEQHATVAPVGAAWLTLVDQGMDSGLWQADGTHPTAEGTYLAACVFYATLFRESPVGLDFHADLGGDKASHLQAVAAAVVLGSPDEWGLAWA